MKNAILLTKYILTPLREGLGVPIIVTSWYRSQELTNKLIELGYGASPNSTHLSGGTIDVEAYRNGVEINGELALEVILMELPFDRMLIEGGTDANPSWIHLEYDGSKSKSDQRRQILRIAQGTTGQYWTAQQVVSLYS